MDSIDPQYTQSAASLASAYLASLLPALAAAYPAVDLAAMVERAGIKPEELADPDFLIPFYRAGAFFLELLKETQDEGLGLVLGSAVQPRSYQTLGYAILSSDTLRQAIDRLIRYEQLVGQLGSTTLVIDETVKLVWHCPFEGPWTRYIREAAITGWVAYATSLLANPVKANAVHFTHELNGDPLRYEAIYGCPVIFSSSFDGVEFDICYLNEPLKSADPGLSALMESRAKDMLACFHNKLNLANEVREQIAYVLPNGDPALEEVAARLKLSGRALQNRLKSLGITFKDVVDEVREQLAYNYLEKTNTSIIDVAFLLGFSEQSSFSRAFKRWSGLAPIEYRRQKVAF